MAKLGLIFPYQDIMDTAEKILPELNFDIVYKRVVETTEALDAAREASEAGADIVIARGYQAALIKQHTNIPVVELRLHAQEIGLLLKKAKELIKTERPHIGLIVFNNMLCDTSHMDELFGVQLEVSNIIRSEEIFNAVKEMTVHGVDLFIGGATVCDIANDLGYPALLYNSSEESVREAFREAGQMAVAMDTEKKEEAQFEAVLDTTLNGIIKINSDGNITTINRPVEDLLGKGLEDVVGLPVLKIFPEFDEKMIENILAGKADSYTVSVNLHRQAWLLLMAPIQYQDSITGAILSLQKLSESIRRKDNVSHGIYMSGYKAEHEFRDFHVESAEMREQLELAKRYALSDSPVLIYGEPGTEYVMLAESIHNNSSRKNEPFISIDLEAMNPDDQMKEFFGERADSSENEMERNKAAVVRANHGTLFIKRVDLMTPQVQERMISLLHSYDSFRMGNFHENDLIVRLIVYTNINLKPLLESGKFNSEFFYQLQSLTVEIPPLRRRTDELVWFFKQYFDEFNKKYNKYLVYTKGVLEWLQKQRWEGNHLQLRSFCERLILTSDKRRVDETMIEHLYNSLYPKTIRQESGNSVVVYRTPEADELESLLEKYHGNRKEVAEELGISTTTLWRRMQKYGIK